MTFKKTNESSCSVGDYTSYFDKTIKCFLTEVPKRQNNGLRAI